MGQSTMDDTEKPGESMDNRSKIVHRIIHAHMESLRKVSTCVVKSETAGNVDSETEEQIHQPQLPSDETMDICAKGELNHGYTWQASSIESMDGDTHKQNSSTPGNEDLMDTLGQDSSKYEQQSSLLDFPLRAGRSGPQHRLKGSSENGSSSGHHQPAILKASQSVTTSSCAQQIPANQQTTHSNPKTSSDALLKTQEKSAHYKRTPCDICGMIFTGISDLILHKSYVHDVKSSPGDNAAEKTHTRGGSTKSMIQTRGGSTKSMIQTRCGSTKSMIQTRGGSTKSMIQTRGGSTKSMTKTRGGSTKSKIKTRGGSTKSIEATIDDVIGGEISAEPDNILTVCNSTADLMGLADGDSQDTQKNASQLETTYFCDIEHNDDNDNNDDSDNDGSDDIDDDDDNDNNTGHQNTSQYYCPVIQNSQLKHKCRQKVVPKLVLIKTPSVQKQCCNMYKCCVCWHDFDTSVSLRKHMLIHQSDGVFKCFICRENVYQLTDLITHLAEEHAAENVQTLSRDCTICNGEQSQEETQEMSLEKTVHICTVCGHICACLHVLKKHLVKTHNRKKETCDVYNKNSSKLTENMMRHKELKPYKCDICDFRSARRIPLKQHMEKHLEQKQYKCSECAKLFYSSIRLTRHEKAVHNKDKSHKQYKCDRCDYTANQRGNLKLHILRHSGERNFECLECGKRFYSNGHLTAHMKTHTGEVYKPYACDECDKTFEYSYRLTEHKTIHTGERPYVCDVCGKCFRVNGTLIQHFKGHSDDKPFVCPVCGLKSKYAGHLKVHMKTHTGEKPHVCHLCGKAFLRPNKLTLHMRTHTGEKPYKCEQCERCFSTRYGLNKHKNSQKPCKKSDVSNQHIKSELNMEPNKWQQSSYPCGVCGEIYSDPVNLAVHMKFHDTDRRYVCHKCKKRFSAQNTLVQHMKTHTGEKPYKCRECSQCFSQTCHLQKHIVRHHTEKAYTCQECGDGFNELNSLTTHMKYHDPNRQFICSVCSKRFDTKYALSVHEKKHEKPFVCDQCGRGFGDRGILRQHMRTHTGEKPFRCVYCGKSFSQLSNLNRHKNTHAS